MAVLQSTYMLVLKPIEAINTERNQRVRHILIAVGFFALFLLIFMGHFNDLLLDETGLLASLYAVSAAKRSIIGAVILFVIALLSVEKDNHRVEWNWFAFYSWCFLCILIVISGCFHNIGEGAAISQLAMLIVCPFLFFTWQSRDRLGELYALMSWAIIALVIIVSILLLAKYSWGEMTLMEGTTRYKGLCDNPNRLGFFAVTGTIASVYLCCYLKKPIVFLPAVTLGLCGQLAWASASRSSVLAIGAIALVAVILYAKKGLSIKLLVLMIVIALAVFGLFGIGIKAGADSAQQSESFSTVLGISAVYAEDQSAEGGNQSVTERLQVSESGEFTSGRIFAWRTYLNELNMTGHDIDYCMPVRVTYKLGGRLYYSFYGMAHNTALEIAFRSGSLAGILYMLLMIAALIYVLKAVFGDRKRLTSADIFSCTAVTAVLLIGGVETLVESMNDIFNIPLTMVLYLALGSVFYFKGNRKEEV